MKSRLQYEPSKIQYITVTILLMLLISSLVFSLASTFKNKINLNKKEVDGTHQLESLFKLSGLVQKVRGLNNIILRNNKRAGSLTLSVQTLSDNVVLSIDSILSDQIHNLNSLQQIKLVKLKKELINIFQKNKTSSSQQHYFNECSGIIEGIISLMRDVAIHTKMVLDDQLDTYYLGMIMMDGLPKFSEEIGKTRGMVSAIPINTMLSSIDKERINNRVDAVLIAIERLKQYEHTILENTANIQTVLYKNIIKLKSSAVLYNSYILSRNNNVGSIKPKLIFDRGTEVINLSEVLHSNIGEYLRGRLNKRILKNNQYLLLSIIAGLFSISIMLLFSIYLYRVNNNNLSEIIKSRTMLETILNTIPVGVYWKNIDGKYLGANKVYLKNIGGKDIDFIYGKNDEELNFVQGSIPSSIYDKEIIQTCTAKYHTKLVLAWTQGPELIDISRVPLLNSDSSVFGVLGVYQDITEEIQQQDKLIKSEAHFRYLIESSFAISWKFDISTQKFIYVGPQVVKLLGYPIEDWYQINFLRLHIHPDDRQQLMKYYMSQSSENQECEIEYRIRTRAGDYVWVRDNIMASSNFDAPNILRGFMFDITHQKKSEIELRLLATAFESQQSILITDKNTTILRVNEAFTKTTGYEEHEVIGKTPNILSSGYHDNDYYSELWSSLMTTGRWEGELWNRRKNGEIFPEWLGISTVTDDEGLITHYVASFIDLSERYEIQAREKLILDSTSEAIYGVDNNGLCTFVNPACLNLIGYDKEEELIGKNMFELTRFSAVNRSQLQIDENSNKKNNQDNESLHYLGATLWRKDGSNFPTELWVQPIKRVDKVLGNVVTFIDISERMIKEQELLSSKNESDKANLAKSEFLARMSHELRTPLNAVIGFVQLLKMGKTLSLNSSQFATEIQNAGDHLLSLINDVLDLAKIESSQINIELKSIPLIDTINQCASLITSLTQQSGIEFKYDVTNLDSIFVNVDPTRLNEVLLNLLSNAVKYNSENGKIILKVELITDARLRIIVTDTGKGLSEIQQKKLFKPFERLGAEHTNIEGTGIGLVISKHIIELMNGNVGFDSIYKKGSSFWIELDYLTQNKENEISFVSDNENIIDFNTVKNKNFNILYVEDNPANIRLMEYLINEIPFIKLKIAVTAESALDIIQEREPDLMIFDINLPSMNGYDLLEKVRTIQHYENTPIFAMSAKAMTKDIEMALAQGFTQYMTKPIDIPHFLNSLFKTLGVESG